MYTQFWSATKARLELLSTQNWITTEIKRIIRKHKRAYRRAKSTGLETDWQKFKKVRNSVVNTVRKCKKVFYDKLALKLKSESLSSKDCWSTLKKFISPQSKSSARHSNLITLYTQITMIRRILSIFFFKVKHYYKNRMLCYLTYTLAPLNPNSVISSLVLMKWKEC